MAQHIHFIAIGGSAMHNLAIALHKKGYLVTGSDDEIFDPARSRLYENGLLPSELGWFSEKINKDIDAVILGMHARGDNPELIKAKELGLKIYSYPEFLYEQSKDKLRVVIGGSHGKTTITAMVLHVLQFNHIDCDYMVGAKLEGFDVMVRLSEKAQIMVFEGDEYLTSALDLRPKFHLYHPNIALVSGIAWDHKNVFKTFEDYIHQFKIFMDLVPENGAIVYCNEDKYVSDLAESASSCKNIIPYSVPKHKVIHGKTFLQTQIGDVPISVFGNHNLMNLEGARLVCKQLGVSDKDFFLAIGSFKGASNRLELMVEHVDRSLYRDFAHAPSKLKATIDAMKSQFPERKLIACFELHTYSSLSIDFLPQYKGCMDAADIAVVYFSPHALELKKLPMLEKERIKQCFERLDLNIFTQPEELQNYLLTIPKTNTNLLMMSSGNWDGMSVKDLI